MGFFRRKRAWDYGSACHRGNLTKCGSLKNQVGAKLVLMVDWSTIELWCSNFEAVRGAKRVYWGTIYRALCSDFRFTCQCLRSR